MNSERKIIVLLGDGMADEPVPELGNKTPLEVAKTPNMDALASKGVMGLARTIPAGIAPGSDTANLSIFGYNPSKFYTGRAPLEALNMGITLGPNDAAFRCNIVNLENGVMADFTAGHIDTGFSTIIMNEMNRNGLDAALEFYPGVSYRNMLVWRNFPFDRMPSTTPPHDITGRKARGFYPSGNGAELLNKVMHRSVEIIAESLVIADGRNHYHGDPVSVWLWGGGRKPAIEPLTKRFGLRGCTISAVDLIHGIGRAAGLIPRPVEGATGYIDTNYEGKAAAALEALSNGDNFVFLHVESPDESGHEGNIQHKLQSIEDFDAKVVGPVLNGIAAFEDCTVLLMPDHPTPLRTKTHSSDPVPFVIYRQKGFPAPSGYIQSDSYNEPSAAQTGVIIDDASVLMESLIKGSLPL
jgi:2,3-bisphosphoglycerate-independent phosphoglycerate mutase